MGWGLDDEPPSRDLTRLYPALHHMGMLESTLWPRAANLAARLHQAHSRRDGTTPYFAHPARVAMILAVTFQHHEDTVLAAAFLHDVIEDTPADFDDVAEAFGTEVATLVAALTKDMRLPEPEREAAYERQLRDAPWQARLIKLADVLDNLGDASTARDRQRTAAKARVALELAGDEPRLAAAVAIVSAALERLDPETE